MALALVTLSNRHLPFTKPTHAGCVKTITLSDISLKTGSKDPKHSRRSRGQLSSFTLCKLRFLYNTKVARPWVAVAAKLRLACFCLISLSLMTSLFRLALAVLAAHSQRRVQRRISAGFADPSTTRRGGAVRPELRRTLRR